MLRSGGGCDGIWREVEMGKLKFGLSSGYGSAAGIWKRRPLRALYRLNNKVFSFLRKNRPLLNDLPLTFLYNCNGWVALGIKLAINLGLEVRAVVEPISLKARAYILSSSRLSCWKPFSCIVFET